MLLVKNPKRVYQESKIKTRMNIAALLRETLYKTKEYMEKKRECTKKMQGNTPAYDMRLEAMIPVLKKRNSFEMSCASC